MKLQDIYTAAIESGIEADTRARSEIDAALAAAASELEDLPDEQRRFFDRERLTNPYDDTRICTGDPDMEVRGLIAGIDMQVGEVVLADRLRDKGMPLDLIFAHHPEGPGLANLHRVMYMQADLWAARGVGIGVADGLIAPRAEEVLRRFMPFNHYQAIDAARLLGFASMSCHTPADNNVNRFVQQLLDTEAPRTLDDVLKVLRTVPEYADAAMKGYGPMIVSGTGSKRCGSCLADMTGGTEGPKEALDRLAAAGVDTLVGMHYSEEYRKHAEELKVNLVVAGHVSSDTLGMNLVLDPIERAGVEIVCTSGMVRVSRT